MAEKVATQGPVARRALIPPALYTWVFHLRPRVIPEGLVLVLILMLISSFAIEWVTPFDPKAGELGDRFISPRLESAQFWDGHLFGTDQLGRDIFARFLIGARYSLAVAGIALGIAGFVGLAIGLIAGYSGGAIDAFLMRVTDSVLALPVILLALLLAGVFGPGMMVVSISLAAYIWAVYARMMRGETLSIMTRDFVKQAKVAGAGPVRIMVTHVFPHVTSTFVVLMSLQIGSAILAESSLSFLGAGIPPPTPTWGSMAAEGRRYIQQAWWVTVFPGIGILIVVLCFNLIGDWLRDRLDPRLEG